MTFIFLNSNIKNEPAIVNSQDAWLIRKDKKKLFDTWLGSGTLIFGHKKENLGCQQLLPEGLECKAKLIRNLEKLVSFEIGGIGFQTSGSSAITRTARLARSMTNRNRIALIGKFWHGSDDEYLFKENKQRISMGIPESKLSEVDWFQSIDEFLSIKSPQNYAALMVEPYQGANPQQSVLKDMTPRKREILNKEGIIVICDEIITGFREQYGSCKISRKVEPDIVVFGKTIGLGYPLSVVLVSKKIIKKTENLPFWGGTYSASPTQIRCLNKTLKKLVNLDYKIINENHQNLNKRVGDILEDTEFKLVSGCKFSRILKINQANEARQFLNKSKDFETIRERALEEDIYISHNGMLFPSIYNITTSMES